MTKTAADCDDDIVVVNEPMSGMTTEGKDEIQNLFEAVAAKICHRR